MSRFKKYCPLYQRVRILNINVKKLGGGSEELVKFEFLLNDKFFNKLSKIVNNRNYQKSPIDGKIVYVPITLDDFIKAISRTKYVEITDNNFDVLITNYKLLHGSFHIQYCDTTFDQLVELAIHKSYLTVSGNNFIPDVVYGQIYPYRGYIKNLHRTEEHEL